MTAPATMEGMGIGDALGAPFEQPNSAIEPPARLASWKGEFLDTHGAYGEFKAGEWTDDTGMGVALAEALLECRGFLPGSVMCRYLRWYKKIPAALVGGTIKKAMENFRYGDAPDQCGILGSEGNGAAMRCAPIGLFYWRDFEKAMEIARADASLTHRSLEAKEGSAAVAGAVAIITKWRKESRCVEIVLDTLIPKLLVHLRHSKLRTLLTSIPPAKSASPQTLKETLCRIGTRGHVLQTVPSAFACLILTRSFEEAVMAAVRGGDLPGDADTTGAITGALAGTLYGQEGIPDHWRTGVQKGNFLRQLDECLLFDAHLD